jgi:hypothetical protein
VAFYYLEPEVAGWVTDSLPDLRSQVVNQIHYEFDGWLGDALLESFPCWIVIISGKAAIQLGGFTGVTFGDSEVSPSHQFKDLYPDRKLPRFAWLKVHGTAGRDDFGISPDHILVVSERALNVLQGFGIDHAEIRTFQG